MTCRPIVLGLILAAGAGCAGESTSPAMRESTAAPLETHAEEENAIHLSDDMVRDLRLSTSRVEERVGAQEVEALGELSADGNRYAEVGPPAGGQIVRLLGEADAVVRPGDPLAELRSGDLGRARADMLVATARRDLARQTLERKRGLAGERIVALREVQEADAALQAAEAETRAAAAVLEAFGVGGDPAGTSGPLFLLRAPIAGRIVERRAVLGQYAEPSAVLFTIADLTRMWMVAHVFERDAVNVRVGTTAHVTLAALPGQEFDGRIALVGRQVEAGSRTLPVRIDLANADGRLRPGMSAGARIPMTGPAQTILAVPVAALQRVGERWLAFVPNGQNEYEMRPVGRGRDLGNEVEVVSGLRAGETVVVEGAFLLKAEAEKRSGGAAHEH